MPSSTSTGSNWEPTWENIRKGLQLRINGYVWEVLDRTNNTFTLYSPVLSKQVVGKPTITKPVEVVYPDDRGYIGKDTPSDLSLEYVIHLVSEQLGGRLI